MRHDLWLPPAVLGFLAGWVVRSLWSHETIALSVAVSSGTTLYVAYFINRTLSRRSEVNRVPVDVAGRLFTRLESLTVTALDTATDVRSSADPKLTVHLRSLSNEIAWMRTFIRRVHPPESVPCERVAQAYFAFKEALCGDAKPQPEKAAPYALKLREECLLLQTRLSGYFVDDEASLEP